ncbi:MAG: hypothetical protein ACFE8G_12095 [Candidatus Hermodarchaeota archaeon]
MNETNTVNNLYPNNIYTEPPSLVFPSDPFILGLLLGFLIGFRDLTAVLVIYFM